MYVFFFQIVVESIYTAFFFFLNKKVKTDLVVFRFAIHGRKNLIIIMSVIDTLHMLQCVQLYVNLL